MRQLSFVERIKQLESAGRRFGSDGKILQGPQTRYGTAKGEMQVLDDTARDPGYGVAPAKNDSPEELARVGTQYAEALLQHFGGDEVKAAAAYNHGPGNIQKLLSKHGEKWMSFLPRETKNYVAKLGTQEAAAPVALVATNVAPEATVIPAPVSVPLPPEMLAQVQVATQPQAPQLPVDPGPDPWATFLRTVPGRAQPVNVADIDYSNPKTATRLSDFQLNPMPNAVPNFQAFSSWKGRTA